MSITINSVLQAITASSIVMMLLVMLRKHNNYYNRSNSKVILSLYLICLIRIIIPIELDLYTVPLSGGKLWRVINDILLVTLIEFNLISINFLTVLVLLWIIVAAVKIFSYIQQYRRVHKFYWKCLEEIEHNNYLTFNNLDIIKTKIIKTKYVDSPCCMGIIKRMILLPEYNYSEKEEKQILVHENQHLTSCDMLIKYLINIICRIYWWNPIAMLLQKDLNQSLEICCDLRVIEKYNHKNKVEYIEAIVEEYKRSAKKQEQNELMLAMSDGSVSEMLERINAITSANNKKILNQLAMVFIVILIMCASYSFVIQANYEPEEIEYGDYEGQIYTLDRFNTYIHKSEDGKYYLYYKKSNYDKAEKLYEISTTDLEYYYKCNIKEK